MKMQLRQCLWIFLSCTNKVIPFDDDFKHREGNSAVHIKVGLFGPAETIALDDGICFWEPGNVFFSASLTGPEPEK